MALPVERVTLILRAIVHESRTEKIPFLAGSIAYHAFVSLLPLFALLFYVAAGLGDQTLERGLILLSRAVFTEGAQEVLIREMRDASRSTGLSVLGLVVLVWGTLRIFRGLDTAFSDIYETEEHNSFLDQLRDGVLVLVTFALGVLISVVIYRSLPTAGALAVLRPVVMVLGLTVVLLPMYYVFPDTDVTVGEILPGATLAAAGLTAFHVVFQVYVQSGEQNVIGGILLLLTWLYFGGLVLLVGVVVNAVLSNRSTDVSVEPVFGGVRPVEEGVGWTDRDLRHALATLEDRITRRTALSVTVGGETIELPPPAAVDVGEDANPTLTVRWNPANAAFVDEETDSEDADGDGPAAPDPGGAERPVE